MDEGFISNDDKHKVDGWQGTQSMSDLFKVEDELFLERPSTILEFSEILKNEASVVQNYTPRIKPSKAAEQEAA